MSNVVNGASFVMSAATSRRALFIYGSILAGSALLNTQWLFYGVWPSLRPGYFCWLASFCILAAAAFFRAGHKGKENVSTRELLSNAVPMLLLMNLGIFTVLGILWFVIK
ncbi:MAG TPA: hypothetical protein VKE98_18150 [Gemmataceae bacterium]|nr:hypothetical protein [Gemmataceae bacterium]